MATAVLVPEDLPTVIVPLLETTWLLTAEPVLLFLA